MRNFGKFWQLKMNEWYPQSLEWVRKIVFGEVEDPAKVFFPEKLHDFDGLDIVTLPNSHFTGRVFSYEDLSLRKLFQEKRFGSFTDTIETLIKRVYK